MPADRRWPRNVNFAPVVAKDEALGYSPAGKITSLDKKRCGDLLRALFDHPQDRLLVQPDDRWNTRLKDSGLLCGDTRTTVTPILHVIHGDRRDDALQRPFNDIGCIETPAQTDLQKKDIRRLPREGQEAGSRRDLKKRDRIAAVGSLTFLQKREQRRLFD